MKREERNKDRSLKDFRYLRNKQRKRTSKRGGRKTKREYSPENKGKRVMSKKWPRGAKCGREFK